MLLAFIIMAACEIGVLDEGMTPESIELDVTEVELVSGRAVVIQAKVKDGKGKPVNVGVGALQIEWSSSDDRIASVTPLGQAAARVTGRAGGTAEITASITVDPPVSQAGFLVFLKGTSGGRRMTASAAVHVRPADLRYVGGSGQTGEIGSTLSGELVVRAVDADGNGVANVDIDFVADRGHGTLEPSTVVTDENGRARSRWTLGETAGELKAEARAHNRFKLSPVEFSATAVDEKSDDDGSAPPPSVSGLLPAFPGAEGWGATALNDCRSMPLVVHKVTNTNASGSGSLDAALNAVSATNFDIIIFTTGGHIELSGTMSYTSVRNCVYIAGQTAPGGGITISGGRIRIDRHSDLVIRHLRHRGKTSIGFNIRLGNRVILSDLSLSWAGQSTSGGSTNLTTGDAMNDVTVQSSLMFEPDLTHPTNVMVSTGFFKRPEGARFTLHRNFMSGPGWRIPKVDGDEMTVSNNVIYNWTSRGSATSNTAHVDWINNYHKPGPATSLATYSGMPMNMGDGCGGDGDGPCSYSFYVSGNLNHMNDFGALPDEPWDGPNRYVGCRNITSDTSEGGGWCPTNGAIVPEFVRRFVPHPAPPILRIQPMSAALRDEILAAAGHRRRLECDGSWTNIRDTIDQERIDWFYAGTGPSSPVDVDTMTISTPAAGKACPDADGDGLPDAWEERFFDCATCADPAGVTQSGYLVIEHYLNGTNPNR